ncbi:phage tail tape measure protein, partial [Salmonella enterica]|nr:phage tail tape measure protein [Salmonella enterica]
MDVDTARLAAGLQTASNGLGKLVDNSDLVEKRIKRCMESSARSVAASAKSISTAMSQSQVATRAQGDAVAQLAREVDEAREKAVALSQKLRAEAAQSAAVAQAQDLAAAAFFRQLDSVKQLSGGLQELQRIQSQVQHAKNNGDISQQDYLALISDVTAKKHLMAAADEQAAQSKNRFIQSLKQQVTTQQLSRAELLRVKAAELGVSSAADVYIRKLDTAAKSTHALGLKSAMARREIGVLIGELARGNFGALRGSGITLANRAGWLETLMSPKGLMIGGVVGGIATAVYGLGKAFYEGEKEGEEFNKQLILTGGYAGKTAGQLQNMARALAGNGVTQHDAAGVLAQVVGSGAFSGSDVNMVARTAARMKEVVGQSVDETVNQFKRLKGDPVNAIIELNNSLHFLTAAQYQQIAAAHAQGDSERAAALAMRAYSDSTNQRLNAVKDNLGTLESAWNWVKNAASGAWDAMLGVGRDPSSAMKRQGAFTDWQAAEKNYKQLSENLKVDPDYSGNNPLTRRDAERLRDARKMVDLKKQ